MLTPCTKTDFSPVASTLVASIKSIELVPMVTPLTVSFSTVAVGQNSASILCAFSVDDGVNGLGIDRILLLGGIRLGEREARLGES